jgi:hypothetical protein
MEAQREQSDREATKEERAQRAEYREGQADKREVISFSLFYFGPPFTQVCL